MRSHVSFNRTNDAIVFKVLIGKPYFVADVDRVARVPYADRDSVPIVPEQKPYHYNTTLMFWVPRIGVWLGFDHAEYMERSAGPLEEDIYGPYRIMGESEPSSEEIEQAGLDGVIQRVKQR